MGIDAVIEFLTKDGEDPNLMDYLPNGFDIVKVGDSEYSSYTSGQASHSINTYSRYYSPSYARGNWPAICSTLMSLFAADNVLKVWYGGDCSGDLAETTIQEVLDISKFYMENGDRPYRSYFKKSESK